MEMTEYGKHGKPRSRLSTLPTLLGSPYGITTFPRPLLLAYTRDRNPRPLDLKGVVMEVLGPNCNSGFMLNRPETRIERLEGEFGGAVWITA